MKRIFGFGIVLSLLAILAPSAIVMYRGLKGKVNHSNTSKCSNFVTRCRTKTKRVSKRVSGSLNVVSMEQIRKLKEQQAVNFRIYVGFLQVANLYKRVAFSKTLSPGVFDSISNGDIGEFLGSLEIECVLVRNFYSYLLVYTLTPLAVIGCMALCILFLRCCVKFAVDSYRNAIAFALWMTLQVLLLTYPGVSSVVLQTFDWDAFEVDYRTNESYYALRSDYSIDYSSSSSQRWRVYAGIMVAVYPIGVVVLFACLIRLSNVEPMARM